MLNLRRCQSFIDIPKSTVIAMLPEKSRIRKRLAELNKNSWQITSFDPKSRLVCVDIIITSNVQEISMSMTPSGGFFSLTFDGQTTETINYSADSSDIRLALNKLSNISAGDIGTSGGPFPNFPIKVFFKGNFKNQSTVKLKSDSKGLTGSEGGNFPIVLVGGNEKLVNHLAITLPVVSADFRY